MAVDEVLLTHVKAMFKNRSRPTKTPFFFGALGGLDDNRPDKPTNVFLVDGDKMRVEYDMDFISANNSEEQPTFVKDLNGGKAGAIYIDDRTTPDQWIPDCYHEAKEYSLMCLGWTYEKAHERANAEEKIIRQKLTADHATPNYG